MNMNFEQINNGFEIAMQEAIQYLEEYIDFKIDPKDKEKLLAIAYTALGDKLSPFKRLPEEVAETCL